MFVYPSRLACGPCAGEENSNGRVRVIYVMRGKRKSEREGEKARVARVQEKVRTMGLKEEGRGRQGRRGEVEGAVGERYGEDGEGPPPRIPLPVPEKSIERDLLV
jgi:hypothetical protein